MPGDPGVCERRPVGGIAIRHELTEAIELELRDAVPWSGRSDTSNDVPPITIRHLIADARPLGMQRALEVPPWCTYWLDPRGEPAIQFHGVFGEVDRLVRTVVPGYAYHICYAAPPREPVLPLQAELATYSLAIAARGNGLIAHSCAFVTRSGSGVLCPGVSGTGKTTLALLLAELDPAPTILTDDRAVIDGCGETVRLWGTPWPGAARIAHNVSAPLDTVVFIRHGVEFGARDVPAGEAFRRILNALSIPLWQPSRCGAALELVDRIMGQARLVEVTYPPTALAAAALLELVAVGAPAAVV